MKEILLIAPVKKPEDIDKFSKHSSCRSFYVYHTKFINNNFEYIKDFISAAKRNDCSIFINFKHNINEEELPVIKKMIKYLKTTDIDGIFINSFAVLEVVKIYTLPFKVIIDSYFDIHNLSGIDFVNNFHNISGIIVTEEIYLKNIIKLKKYMKLPLAIDSDNLPWFAEDVQKTEAIDAVVIKGKFNSSEEILDGIRLIEKILKTPKLFKKQNLPFKHVRKSFYKTDHFSGDVVCADGGNFKFSGNIENFEWKCSKTKLKTDIVYKKDKDYKICLRLSKLSQILSLKRFINKIGFNPIDSIEFGEIVSTSDLANMSFENAVKRVMKFCKNNNIQFCLSTPKILIERDFDRVYEYCKKLLLSNLCTNPSIVINNIGYFWAVINDNDLSKFSIEIGQGINLANSLAIKCLINLHRASTVDFTSQQDVKGILTTLSKVKNIIPNRKLTIAGNISVPCLGLCPLNNDSAVISRLSCKAPCHSGSYALKEPLTGELHPFTCDGFCRMHLFENKIIQNFEDIDRLQKHGINEFVFDFSAIDAKFVPIILTNYLNSIYLDNDK